MPINSSTWYSCTRTILLALFAVPFSSIAQENKDGTITFAFTLENDVFAGTDQNYTNGTRLSWDFSNASSYSEIDRLPAWAREAGVLKPDHSRDPDSFGATISLGQSVFTPNNIEARELQENDRPYAGWSYLSLALREHSARHSDILSLTLGVVGPDSFAEDVQMWVHETIDSTEARGWDNQLKNELGAILAWRRESELFSLPDSSEGWGADFNTVYGLALGNIYSYAHAGANVRIGYNRNGTAAPPRISPGDTSAFPVGEADPRLPGSSNKFGIFLTVGSEGRYVGRNLFVEGNTWENSHGLKAERWVGDYYTGITLISNKWSLSYAYTRRSKEFEEQRVPHEFGGVTITRSF